MLKLTVWMNMPSFYQSDLFQDLAATGEVDLRVVYAKRLPADRRSLGWREELSGFAHHFLDEQHPFRDALRIARAERDRLHVVNGIWAELAFAAALCMMLFGGTRYVIYSEAPNATEERSAMKKIAQRLFGRAVVRRAAGLLPISRLAEEFYRRLGARESQLYPFGYFRAKPRGECAPGVRQAGRDEVVYVGQLVRRKGLDLLLEAMRPLFDEYPGLHLTLVGGGEMREELERQAASLGSDGRVTFEGAVSSDEVRRRMAGADLAVLPSRWDGWGLVVNEALSVGVPVILSDRCGASDLIRDGFNGYVFRSEDVGDLNAKLCRFMAERDRWDELRAASAAVGVTLSTESAARYLVA
ncbi:MAG: glycosyltransferase family 4 protein, partial [Acidobacteriota bacterium]|nr:glycosyltransferase family 4 protein [Acidobacteriota bacterium]